MTMMVKYCRYGHENADDAEYCETCGDDLFLVTPVEKKEPKPQEAADMTKPAAPAPSAELKSGRLCRKCNQLKPISMFTCDVCGSNLSSAPIMRNDRAGRPGNSAAPDMSAAVIWELCTPEEQPLLTLREGEKKLIGWENELASYLNESFSFVSRAHAYIGVEKGSAYIIDNNSTNGVQIRHQNIPAGQRYILQSGDQIALGDRKLNGDRRAAYFIIRKSGR